MKAHMIIVAMLLAMSEAVASGGELESFDVVVSQVPSPVQSDDHQQLLYELHLTNFAAYSLVLRSVRVLNADSQQPLAEFSNSLTDHLILVGASKPTNHQSEIIVLPGERAILFVELALDDKWPH